MADSSDDGISGWKDKRWVFEVRCQNKMARFFLSDEEGDQLVASQFAPVPMQLVSAVRFTLMALKREAGEESKQ